MKWYKSIGWSIETTIIRAISTRLIPRSENILMNITSVTWGTDL